jgi:RNA ligase (TIGR02306 family)
MKLASIQIIADLRPIPGADRIEAATVLGYQTVVKKGEFRPGDLCVWHEPDTIVADRPEYEFLRKQGFRLKVARFKGQVSQGLAMPPSALGLPGGLQPGDDVTSLLGIIKYEKPVPANLSGLVKGGFPGWLVKTDEPNLRSYPEALAEFTGRRCVITQKVDGTSGTFYRRQGQFGVCSRNLELLEDATSTFWRVARQFKIEEALATLDGDFALQGEVHGEGIQSNHLRIRGVSIAAFSLFDIIARQFLGHAELASFCQKTSVPMVRPIWEGDFQFTLDELVALANQQEYSPGNPAEGIVIRPVEEARSQTLPNGRLSAKVPSESYALKYGE